METKNQKDVLVDLQVWLGFDRIITVDPVGLSGGLAIMWKASVGLDFKFVNKNIVDFDVSFQDSRFFLSCIYGAPEAGERSYVWERLLRINANRFERWCMIGDFNEITHNGEKLGGPKRSESSFKPFVDMLNGCDMTELPGTGNGFTWAGKRYTHWIQCKLDRTFANKKWLDFFPKAKQFFLDPTGSDHRPVLLVTSDDGNQKRGQFRFDQRWIGQPGALEAVAKGWNNGEELADKAVLSRLGECRKNLSRWKKEVNTNSASLISQLKDSIEVEMSLTYPCFSRLSELKKELAIAYHQEEIYWKQKSRQKWLKVGDNNTSFFHAAVKADRAKRTISNLIDDDGVTKTTEADKAYIASSFFQKLFTSSGSSVESGFFDGFDKRITAEMDIQLMKPITIDEIKEAVFSIKPSSAPGFDGMNGFFFQTYWHVIGRKVTDEILDFFVNGTFPSDWSKTLICLIPKKEAANMMNDLRPISLCSVLYKIISKVLVSRLKPVLPALISPTQSAFVEDRLISDNIIIAHELIHSLRTHEKMSTDFMAIKTDISKAYDRIEWSYLEAILSAFGFNERWIQWLLFCVREVSYSVLLNGQCHAEFTPQRGLRQGDPLSPLLYVLCTEGLIHLLNQAETEGRLQGMPFSERGPMIHHILFADDSLLLCQASVEQCEVLLDILKRYETASGQMVNTSKSAITFGSKVPPDTRDDISALLNITNVGGTGKYLGLPECFSRSKVQMLDYIQEKLQSRLSGWFDRTLSLGGKEVLIKCVALSMPVYAMSCFQMPKATIKKLTSAIANFWWNASEDRQKLHWISWEKLCLPKKDGGMGFRDLEIFNQALLAKQVWRALHEPDSLFARFLKSVYYTDSDILHAGLGKRPSYAWRSMLHGRHLLVRGLKRMVGNGESIKVWSDCWIYDGAMRRPLLMPRSVDMNLRVADLIDSNTGTWIEEKLVDLFFPGDIRIIKTMKPATNRPDFWVWHHNKNGIYSVKSDNWLGNRVMKTEVISEAEAQPSINPLKSKIWSLRTAPKIRIFLWRAISGAIGAAEQLQKRGIAVDGRCQVCGCDTESINHILFTCPSAREVWRLSGLPIVIHESSIYVNFNTSLELYGNTTINREVRESMPWILWILWKNRNTLLFEGRRFMALDTMLKVKADSQEWFAAQQVDQALNPSSSHTQSTRGMHRTTSTGIWSPPPVHWYKCDVSVSGSKKKRICGSAWILRDHNGTVCLHSRRSFSYIDNFVDAQHKSLMWAIESMLTHGVNQICFSMDARELVGVLQRPKEWPAYQGHGVALQLALRGLRNFEFTYASHDETRTAFLLARSANVDNLWRSYVSSVVPVWLRPYIELDRQKAQQQAAVSLI